MTRLVLSFLAFAALSASGPTGTWQGTFWSAETERAGSLQFTVTAEGRVLDALAIFDAVPDLPLALEAAVLDESSIEGRFEPYRDPGCGCWLDTTFRGALEDDRWLGTYTVRAEAGAVFHGAWTAHRSPDP
ncbi:hypothetical protein [Rubrivirga sp.]|uniref:hypothetical protein n=1 Tax=Rubrivirga sp. TaxID=1885344 RepID=UPI003C72F843